MDETQKIHEKFKLSCMGMTYPKAFWRFMEIFTEWTSKISSTSEILKFSVIIKAAHRHIARFMLFPRADPYITHSLYLICDKIDLLFTKKRPRSLRSY